MSIYEWLGQKRGYKAVGYHASTGQAYSLYGGRSSVINITVGNVERDPRGFYLGSTKKFCMDYYSGLTDDDELLLTYEFGPEDLMEGEDIVETGAEGELKVRQARLAEVERIIKDDGEVTGQLEPFQIREEVIQPRIADLPDLPKTIAFYINGNNTVSLSPEERSALRASNEVILRKHPVVQALAKSPPQEWSGEYDV